MHTQLPFLIVHGQTLYIVLAITCVLFGIVLARHLAMRRVKLHTKQILASMEPLTDPANFAEKSTVVVKGVIKFPSDTNLLPGEFTELGDKVLLFGKQPLPCQGQAEVLWVPNLSNSKQEKQALRLRSGQEVHIQGIVHSQASTNQANYRDTPSDWRLVGSQNQPLQIAFSQPPRISLLWIKLAWVSIISLAAFTAIMLLVGSMSLPQKANLKRGNGTLEYPLRLKIAAATLFHRDDTLERLGDSLKDTNLGTQGVLAAMELDILHGDCPKAIHRARKANLWDVAKQTIAQCAPSEARDIAAFEVALTRGEFKEASDLALTKGVMQEHSEVLSDLQLIRVHLLAGRYARAAKGLEESAKRREEKAEKEKFQCLATLAWRLSGKKRKFDIFAGSPHVCQILQSEELSPRERRMHFERLEANASKRNHYMTRENIISILLGAEVGYQYNSFDKNSFHDQILRSETMGTWNVDPYVGLYASALRSPSNTSTISLATFKIKLAYWYIGFGRDDPANDLLSSVIEDILSSSKAMRIFAKTIASDKKLDIYIQENKPGVKASNVFYQIVQLCELGMAKIALNHHTKHSAQRHVDRARAFGWHNSRRSSYLSRDIDIDSLLNKNDVVLFENRSRLPRTNFCDKKTTCSADIQRVHPRFLGYSVFNRRVNTILRMRKFASTLDAPQWQAELQAVTQNYASVLMNRDRSLMLTALRSIEFSQ